MSESININSEIDRLDKVLLHRPNKEIENLVPDYLERLLFDDIPFLKDAQKEHDGFAKILRDNGVEVLYLEDLVEESITSFELKEKFIIDFLEISNIYSNSLKEALLDFLINMDTKDTINNLISGIRKSSIKIKKVNSLSDIIVNKYPFYLDPMPNLYFTRDPGVVIGNGICINSMNTDARRREPFFLEWIFKYHPIYEKNKGKILYRREIPFSLEGGDILVISPKVVAMGCSARTTPEGIEISAKNIFAYTGFEKVLVFEIPFSRAFMHLDTVFTMVDYNKFTIHPEIEKQLKAYEIIKTNSEDLKFKAHTDSIEKILSSVLNLSNIELIRCGGGDAIASGREQWNDGANTLAISPGKVITYNRNTVTNELLDKHNVEVFTMASSELSRGRGGPRCMSMPLYRRDC